MQLSLLGHSLTCHWTSTSSFSTSLALSFAIVLSRSNSSRLSLRTFRQGPSSHPSSKARYRSSPPEMPSSPQIEILALFLQTIRILARTSSSHLRKLLNRSFSASERLEVSDQPTKSFGVHPRIPAHLQTSSICIGVSTRSQDPTTRGVTPIFLPSSPCVIPRLFRIFLSRSTYLINHSGFPRDNPLPSALV